MPSFFQALGPHGRRALVPWTQHVGPQMAWTHKPHKDTLRATALFPRGGSAEGEEGGLGGLRTRWQI